MEWKKLGVVFKPDGSMPWARSHAMIPTPFLRDASLRVYLTFCDEKFIGRPGYVDLSLDNVLNVQGVSGQPLFEIGQPGTFDENGVLATSVVHVDDKHVYLYYVGFELGTQIRYRLLTGLAISEDGGTTFRKLKKTPILERSDQELYFRCGPFVLHEEGIFRMWYVAGSSWTDIHGKPMPVYDLRYMESSDGINWPDFGTVCLPVTDPDEHGFGRPYVVHENGLYKMYFSVRKRSLCAYRLGYAESFDGINWQRKDEQLNLDVSAEGWDSKAIMYSAVQTLHGETYLFYNGNNFGETGFGVALLEKN